MRLSALSLIIVMAAAAAWGAHRLGGIAAGYIEHETQTRAETGLAAAGLGWAEVTVDGLTVTLRGTAPDETRRLQAAEILRRAARPDHLRDETTLVSAAGTDLPPFALKFLRNDAEVSLIGLAPEPAGRAAVSGALQEAGLDGAVNDMVESVDHAAPPGWEAALAFGLDALRRLPRATIDVTPGRVVVTALAPSEEDRTVLLADLNADRPEGLTVSLDISAPRPVIAPFVFEITRSPDGPRLLACTAETAADAGRILRGAGLPEAACAVGLGAPDADWVAAVEAGVEALDALGFGRFALSDLEARLTAGPGVLSEDRAAAEARLATRLPPQYGVTFPAPQPAAQAVLPEAPSEVPHFTAVLDGEGGVEIEGLVQDDVQRAAIESYAAALFGADRVRNSVGLDASLPRGWPQRVLTGMEALTLTRKGALAVTADDVTLTGLARTEDAAAKARALFASREIATTRIAMHFDRAEAAAVAEAEAIAADPLGACARATKAAQERAPLVFEPNSAVLGTGGAAAIAALTEALQACPAARIGIAGHTDGQGRAESNQRLSEARAGAVREALATPALAHLVFTATGFGATTPVADNETPEGRARNRRIEFDFPLSDVAAAEAPGGPE